VKIRALDQKLWTLKDRQGIEAYKNTTDVQWPFRLYGTGNGLNFNVSKCSKNINLSLCKVSFCSDLPLDAKRSLKVGARFGEIALAFHLSVAASMPRLSIIIGLLLQV
jgi:hypothetical protein